MNTPVYTWPELKPGQRHIDIPVSDEVYHRLTADAAAAGISIENHLRRIFGLPAHRDAGADTVAV